MSPTAWMIPHVPTARPNHSAAKKMSNASMTVKVPKKTKTLKTSTAPKPAKSELEQIPGVGPSIAADLHGIGVTRIRQLKGRSPQALYEKLCDTTGVIHDRCVLYVFRCAVYYASQPAHDPEKLKWWNWKDAAR